MDYDTKNWAEAVIDIEPLGKAPKKYGEGVYRFGAAMTMSVIMPRRGWELVKKTKSYVYLRPPVNAGNPPYKLRIKVPTKIQALEVAESCYAKGASWMGQIGEWPAWYLHERPQETYELIPSQGRSVIHQKLVHVDHPKSSLNIGEHGVWSVELRKTDGEFSYSEYGNIIRERHTDAESKVLIEGENISLELTIYERNSEARNKCIKHYGAYCQACNFDFEQAYGEIGAGFIHVHHVMPISEKEGEYEVDPISDLVTLCPNCHAMAHRRNPPYAVTELREIMSNSRKAQ